MHTNHVIGHVFGVFTSADDEMLEGEACIDLERTARLKTLREAVESDDTNRGFW